MKIFVLVILGVLLVATSVIAETRSEVLDFDTKCVEEDVILKVRGDKSIVDTYSFKGCEKWKTDVWEFWKCVCVGQDHVVFSVSDVNNQVTYDIVAQIFIEPLEIVTDKLEGQVEPSPIEIDNMNKKRTYTFSDISFTLLKEQNEEKKPFKFSFPNYNFSVVFVFLGIILFIVLGVLVFGGVWIRKQLKDVKPKSKDPKLPPGFTKLSDEEVNEYTKKYL